MAAQENRRDIVINAETGKWSRCPVTYQDQVEVSLPSVEK
jgi:hypothetical protein